MKTVVKWSAAVLAISAITLTGCKEDEPVLDAAPTAADAQFTYAPSPDNPNIIDFTASNANLQAEWDFGNGTSGSGTNAQASYPLAGTYTVKLTVFNSGGNASSTQDIVIDSDDPTLLDDPIYNILTGGQDGPGSKTWVVDSALAGHFGVGPNPSQAGDFPEWYSAQANEKAGAGMYNDRFVFHLDGFRFDHITNGDIYINELHIGNFPNAVPSPVADYISPQADILEESWTVTEGADTTITLSGMAFFGYYTGVHTFRVINIEENQLFLRFEDSQNPDLAWYIRLIPEGYDSGGGTPEPMFSLPMDFETVEPTFTTFGNSSVAIINNPDASGINTSSRVLETVHGNETWAGFFVNLEDPLDFATQTSISVKVWAPDTGTFRFKLEEQANPNNFVEMDASVTQANTWQEISVDFAGSPAVFDRLVLFPGWDVANAGTFYVDDITQQ